MRSAYVHRARLAMTRDGDDRAAGAAVTVALCGHWDHEGPCRVPHRTAVANRDEDHVEVRVLFACEPVDADGVRLAVATALDAGELPVPPPESAPPTRWHVVDQGPGVLLDAERPVAERFVAYPEA